MAYSWSWEIPGIAKKVVDKFDHSRPLFWNEKKKQFEHRPGDGDTSMVSDFAVRMQRAVEDGKLIDALLAANTDWGKFVEALDQLYESAEQ